MEKVLLLCAAGADTRANYPELKANPGYLTAKVTRPNKTQAVKEFVSRFGKAVEPMGRPEGTEGVVVPASIATKKKKSKHADKRHTEGQQEGEPSSRKKRKK